MTRGENGCRLNKELSLEDIEDYITYRRDYVIPMGDFTAHGHLSDILNAIDQMSED